MNEITIAQPLSGEEVVEAILCRVKETLRKDCYLNPNAAYEAFTADIRVEVRLKDCGRMPEVNSRIRVASEKPVDEDAALIAAEAHLGEAPPNQVRMESNQGIPTLVQTAEGKSEVKNVLHRASDRIKRAFTGEEPPEI